MTSVFQMDALMQSMSAVNLQRAPCPRALQFQQISQKLPIAVLEHESRSTRLVATLHFTISKGGLCIVSKSNFTHNPLVPNIPRLKSKVHECRFVMQDTATGGYATTLVEIAQ